MYESLQDQSEMRSDSIESRKLTVFQKFQTILVLNKIYPLKGEFANIVTLILSTIGIFVGARVIFGDIADVGGTIFSLLILILFAIIGGKCVQLLSWMIKKMSNCCKDINLPPVLGMLIVGILLKNIPYNVGQFGRGDCINDDNETVFIDTINDRDLPKNYSEDCYSQYIAHDLDPIISSKLRTLCLTVIILMSGLEVDPMALWKLGGMILRATFIPFTVEVVAVAILSNFLLEFPWTIGFVMGIVVAAASLAVIVPCLMIFSSQGYGVKKGIPTLVISTGSLQNVLSISAFGILFGITIGTGKELWELSLKAVIEIFYGLVFGAFWGLVAQWIPNTEHPQVGFFRWLVLFNGGLIAMFGSKLLNLSGAIATLTMAVTAGMKWRNDDSDGHISVSITFRRMWIILEPILFALIGTELQIDKLEPEELGLEILILIVALVLRIIANYVAVFGGDLDNKERIFKSVALIPKGTIQAALGPMFLDNVRDRDDSFWILLSTKQNATNFDHLDIKEKWEEWGKEILTLAVLSILITAPLGAILITSLGPNLLEIDDDFPKRFEDNNKKVESFSKQ